MGRKYLEELGYDWNYGSEEDDRQKHWAKEREEYGFDNRETWNMDVSFFLWLYERLRMYKEISPVDLTFHKFEHEGQELNLGECIDKIIENIQYSFKNDRYELDEEVARRETEAVDIFSKIIFYLWW